MGEPALPPLDDASGPLGDSLTVEEWMTRCDQAMTIVAQDWAPVTTLASGANVYLGQVPGSPVVSVGWIQDIPEADVSRGTTQQLLRDIFRSSQMGEHANSWDDTFRGCEILADLPHAARGGGSILQWKFSAPPLAKREMVYLIAQQDYSSPEESGPTRTLYGYASVGDAWVMGAAGAEVKRTGRVRSRNLFPSCDRLTVLDGGATLRVEHLMTTGLSGWVPSWAYNKLFASALIKTFAHEADKFRSYVLDASHKCPAVATVGQL